MYLCVSLPYPSGASAWLNTKEKKERFAKVLAELGVQAAALRAHG
jgi:hypothetical protein